MNRCAKIVATIGPASQDELTLRQLIDAGMNVARLNFSHGSHPEHAAVIARLRKVAAQAGKPLCILQDLQGPKIRTGDLAAGSLELVPGQALTLVTYPVPPAEQAGPPACIPVDFPHLPQSVSVGGRILLDDGNMELKVTAIGADTVETCVTVGGTLKSHKGINLPGGALGISGFTEKDERDLAFGLQQGVDAVAVSFVRTAADVQAVRLALARLSPTQARMPIIAKLERPEALDNLESIVAEADGVMVARGDLGVEMSPEAVPIAQKCIIEAANRSAKIVITATQMLDSMIRNPRPTRAEASDVANAVLDGSDAVMLSGETASGQYPLKAVDMMASIVCQAEANLARWGHWKGILAPEQDCEDAYFVTLAARELAHDRNVAAIAVFTQSGRTALLMSKARPSVPIYAFTPLQQIYQVMSLYWGVTSYLVPHSDTIEAMLAYVDVVMAQAIQPGQQVVLVCGFPVGEMRSSNLALLHTVGER